MTKIATIDLETTVRNTGEDGVGSFAASPFYEKNCIVLAGIKPLHKDAVVGEGIGILELFKDYSFLIGQNIKFDLHYLFRYVPGFHEVFHEIQIWDTMIAEYLLTGQDSKFTNLDTLAEKYGGTVKPDAIKEYWDAGVQTEDIPREELASYLHGDLNNTEIVYLGQLKEARRLDMMSLFKTQMRMVQVCADMEYEGVVFDRRGSLEAYDEQAIVRDQLVKELTQVMSAHDSALDNPGSNKQVAIWLFGGSIKDTIDVSVLNEDGTEYRYKSGKRKGQVKTKKQHIFREITGIHKPDPSWTNATGYSVDNTILKKLKNADTKKLLRLRELDKDLDTYYRGLAELTHADGRIHGSLNNCSTNTGRLSSSKPNLQNISGKER